VQITRPAGNYVTLESGGAAAWQADVTTDAVTFTQGDLPYGYSQGFGIQGLAQNQDAGPVNWTVRVSDNADGSGAITCDGNLGLTIMTQPSVINITNVQVGSIGVDRVTVTWDTDVASTSQVQYGEDSNYGSNSALDAALVTSHSVTLRGLKASTGYHFIVQSTTPADGGTVSSSDNTFLTADRTAISEGGGVPGAGAGSVTIGGGPVTTPSGKPTETTPPSIALTSKVTGAYAVSPVFTGTASDNEAVAKVEYSIDGGENWSGVNSVAAATVTTGSGKKKVTTSDAHNVTFSFTPVITEDGNYEVMARATDPSGNQARTAAQTLVIDRLPPRFGGGMVAFGAQVVRPQDGRWAAQVGLDQTITLGAVGGPTQVTVQAAFSGAKHQTEHSFALRRNAMSGLWQGVMSFQKPGTYQLTVAAVDGAGNHTSLQLASVHVMVPAQVQAKGGKLVSSGKVTLYYKQPQNGTWTVWDGAGYGQQNPQALNQDGTFRLLVPAGTYYLKEESKGYQTLVTRQFTVDRPTPLAPSLNLVERPALFGIPLPWISFGRTDISLASSGLSKEAVSAIVGKAMPGFELPTTNGGTLSAVGLLGKPTVVTVLSTWAPSANEQLPTLAKLQSNGDLNVVPMVMGERMGRVEAFLGRSGYETVNVMVDADAALTQSLGVPGLPTHYILDRKGKVKAVLTGVLSANQLLAQLGS
jgi:hypothetical protein